MGIIEDRRVLHRIPELELELPKTMEYLRGALSGLNCSLFSPVAHSLCAFFDFGCDHAIAFRADADALPIPERNDTPYASCHPGRMHACGHDGHMAILLELARRLSGKTDLPHNVLLIFQAGEESPGGAKSICESGVLEAHRVQAIFGLHLWPQLEKGRVFSRENEMMSHGSETNVDIYGRSAHLARAELGIDAMAAAMELYRRVAAAEAAWPRETYRLMKFGRMESGSVRNAVSDHSRLEGSLRAFRDEVFEGLRGSLYAIGADIEKEFGCRVEITMSEGYPAVMNPPELFRRVRAVADFSLLAEPTMTSEDFSWYQRYVPGMFFFLGLGDVPGLHSDNFDFDESILVKGADFFEHLAENFL
jgi:hippurate hydrolase